MGDVLQQLKKLSPHKFQRIYFDPPYASGLYQPVLEAIANDQLLAVLGEIAVNTILKPGHHPSFLVGKFASKSLPW